MKVNSFISTALAIIAAPCAFAVPVPYDGQMEPGEYTILTYAQLTNFTQAVRGTYQNPGFQFTNSTITLTADIDCKGGIIAGHERHGNYYEPSSFSGVFDGAGHTIRNYSVSIKKANAFETGQVSYGLAMFDVVRDGAVIRNLKLDTTIIDKADPTGSNPDDRYYPFDAPCAAAFAMYAEGANAVTFENCTFGGRVIYHGSAAAFVGKATRNPADAPDSTVVTLTGCGLAKYVNIHAQTNTVKSVKSVAGGLVAEGVGIVATDCSAGTSSEDQIWIDGASLAGGIVGRAADSTFTRCTSAANVAYQSEIPAVSGNGCGGLVGHASNSAFRNCASYASVTWSSPVIAEGWWRRTAARSFSAIGGMAGLTDGASEFYDCTVSNTLSCVYGLGGGFVGWTAGAETFSNCTAVVTVKDEVHPQYVVGGFAASVASSGARFIDCTVRATGDDLKSGFYDIQDECHAVGPVGTNWFTRCVVTKSTPSVAGFAGGVTNAVFDGCLVVDSSSGGSGFAGAVACGTFTNCTVSGVSSGLAGFARGATNAVFACCQVTNSTSGGAGFCAKSTRSSFALCTVAGSSAATAGFDGDSSQSAFTDCAVAGSSAADAGFTGESASSSFDGCVVTNVALAAAGFAREASGGTFTNCTVYGAAGRDGFIAKAWAQNVFRSCSVVGAKVANGFVWDAYTGNLFEGCAVLESKVTDGFVNGAGRDDGVFGQNVFRDCRVSGVFMNESGGEGHGFAGTLRNGSMVTNCIAYGVARYEMDAFYGFAGTVSSNAVVSGCVGAVAPSKFTAKGAGFADAIQSGAKVEDCYAVFAPRVDARNYSGAATEGGLQGGFARSVGTVDPPVARCFTLDSIPPGSVEVDGCGAFCGVIAGGTPRFIGCYRPSESTANDSYGMNYDGIGRRSAAEFASATAETFPDYDFENVWRVPAGAASSPYLAAATDADGNFWTYTAVASGLGRVTVNGGEPLDAYPPGTVLTVRAEAVGESQFTGWIGEGFADPMAPETTYTVRNAGAILATFDMGPYDGQKEPGTYLISTVDQLRQFTAAVRSYSYGGSTLVIADDIDCGGLSFVAGNLNTPSAFFGTFDGAGHRIFNFSNTVAANATYGAALFDELGPGACVKDLALEGVVAVESPSLANAAVFAGSARSDYLAGCATIENCSFTGSISNRLGAAVFLGSAFRSPYTREGVPSVILSNCTANASVFTATNAPAGGLVANAIDILAADCSFAGRVESVGTAGGLAGFAANATFTNCTFTGVMAGGTTNIVIDLAKSGCGALVGFASNSLFRACSASADIDWDYATDATDRTFSDYNFIAVGGAAGLTMGGSVFDGCSFEGTVQSVHGYAAGFVGWTGGSELFTNCTAVASINTTGSVVNVALGGFAASVGSRGANFTDCSVVGSSGANAGFFDVQHQCRAAGAVGTNFFTRCSVSGTSASDALFAGNTVNAVFSKCEVRGGSAFSGFAGNSGANSEYADCTVTGATVRVGFVRETTGTNLFTNCRAGCRYGLRSETADARYWGFAGTLGKYAVVNRCAAYGAVVADYFVVETGDAYALFARRIENATVRDSVGAVTQTFSPNPDGRLALMLDDQAVVEGCYSVFQKDAGTDLPASKDTNGRFWTLPVVVAGEGSILVDGAAPAAAYAPGSVHQIRAVPAAGYVFSHWAGRGYGNADSAQTTYTADNIGAIAAVFAKEVATPQDFLAIADSPSASYALADDISLAGSLGEGGATNSVIGEFRGRLYGRGHLLSGVRFADYSGKFIKRTYASLFRRVAPGAQIRDISIDASAGNRFATVAGLAIEIGGNALVSNCTVNVDFRSTDCDDYRTVEYYGIASNVVGSAVTVMDCTVTGTIEASTRAAGFFGGVSLRSGEIARCASFCDVYATAPGGVASGFANSLAAGDGYGARVLVREIVTSGTIYGSDTGAGIAASVSIAHNDAMVRDMYSTAEVRAYTGYGVAAGIARTLYTPASGPSISNVWFGGTARAGLHKNYGFTETINSVTLVNCAFIDVPGVDMQWTTGAESIDIPFASRLSRESWAGYDLDGVWSMTEGQTTPYFAWSLDNGGFRILATRARSTTITRPAFAASGANVAVTAGTTPSSDAFFVRWDGAAAYTDGEAASTTFPADNHRTVSCVWGRNISTLAQLQAVTEDLSGIYHVVADIDMADFDFTTIGGVYYHSTFNNDDYYTAYYPFFGIFDGQGHAISNLVAVKYFSPHYMSGMSGTFGGLFARLQEADVKDIRLVGPQIISFEHGGALAGEVVSSKVSGCSALGVYVDGNNSGSDSGYTGGLVGRAANSEISRSFAAGYVSGVRAGGFAGFVTSGTLRECFASGAVKATNAESGGFAGYIGGEAAVEDSYTVSAVEGGSGFAGTVGGSDVRIERCYSAGIAERATSGASVGGFIGVSTGAPVITDCVRRHYDIYRKTGAADVGSADHANIVALTADEMCAVTNFTAFLTAGGPRSVAAADGTEPVPPIWAQTDGATQPYFPWCLDENGKMPLVTMTIARNALAAPAVNFASLFGLTQVAPGGEVTITADTPKPSATFADGRTFLEWTGMNDDFGKPYLPLTDVKADNVRTAMALYGTMISSGSDLYNITNNLTGTYGLANSIVIPDDWYSLWKYPNYDDFKGRLYGAGNTITVRDGKSVFHDVDGAFFRGVTVQGDLTPSQMQFGAFAGTAKGAVTLQDCIVDVNIESDRSRNGGFFGQVQNGSVTFERCSAYGSMRSDGYSGGFVGFFDKSSFTFIDCVSGIDVSAIGSSYGYGGFIGNVQSTGSGTGSFLRCTASGNVFGASSEVGGFAGLVSRPLTCTDCQATGNITGGYTTSVGGFVGALGESAEGSSFLNCTASGNVTNTSAGAGGFVGRVSAKNTAFTGCSASGDVVSLGTGTQTGGFIGYVYAQDMMFTNCLASGTVYTVFGNAGGFVGVASGVRARFLSCTASGNVMRPSSSVNQGSSYGGFVAYTTVSGMRFEECRALGCVSVPGMDYVGGFAGSIGSYGKTDVSNELIRCMAAGAVKGDKFVGGFCGWFNGTGTKVRECFALGDATACENSAGGFAGRIDSVTELRDSYALGNVRSAGTNAGGFAGYIANRTGMSLTRCYSAGSLENHCYYNYVGGFAGQLDSSGANVAIADCAAFAPDAAIPLHALGGYPAGTTTERQCIAELKGDDFKNRENFTAFHKVLGQGDSPIWGQVDGVTQPYLTWNAPDGNLSVYALVYGSSGGTVSGGGEYRPGETVEISATPGENRFFDVWNGSAPYADATNANTTLTLDNHRSATTQFGRYIRTADELRALTNALDSVVALVNDIDLSGMEWEPLVKRANDRLGFTGRFLGMGCQISGLVVTNNANNMMGHRGLFGRTVNATLDGINVSGKVSGSQNVGGLVGEAVATLITNCTARVDVSDIDGETHNGPFGGLVGESKATTVVGCRADGFVRGFQRTGGLIGSADDYNVIANSAARGDVQNADSVNSYSGGFVGVLGGNKGTAITTITNCWCSGTVWGSTVSIGSFIGQGGSAAKVVDCAVVEGRMARRRFSGNNNENIPFRVLTAAEVEELSVGWPAPMERDFSKAKHIANADDLAAVRDDLSGIYFLDSDINLGGVDWTPIGTNSAPFKGEFYGNGHRISNFKVGNSGGHEGFFGYIEGARIKGLRLKGGVSVTDAGARNDSCAGGFAGRIVYGSLIEDCSFRGDVAGSNVHVGGFAGRIAGASMVAGCCVTGRVEQTSTSSSPLGCGGFVGYISGGGGGICIIDCYSLHSVDAHDNRYAGGFAGYINDKYQLIDTSYCSGSVTNTTAYSGAFIGYVNNSTSVTNSYYDCDATPQLAKGLSSTGKSGASPGITPLTHEAMLHAESFTNFDFVATWKIEEEETTPYLIAIGLSKSGYEKWLEDNDIDGNPEPEDIGNGIPYGFRYAFNIPMDKGPGDFNPPLFRLVFGADGKPRIYLPEQVNEEGVTVEVLASTELSDFSKENREEWTGAVVMQYDPDEGAWRPAESFTDPEYAYPDSMFFRWRLVVER